MSRLSQHLSDAQFTDSFLSDAGERITSPDDAVGTGEACRLIVRGAEEPFELNASSMPVPVDDYMIRVRKSDLETLQEQDLLRVTETGVVYRVKTPPLHYGRDRDQWQAGCEIASEPT